MYFKHKNVRLEQTMHYSEFDFVAKLFGGKEAQLPTEDVFPASDAREE
jgi:hypothetical protein